MSAPWSREALQHGEFVGFVPFRALPEAEVPTAGGVYVVVREGTADPDVLPESSARSATRKDPSVDPEALRKRWVDGAHVLFIGRAASGDRRTDGLRAKLEQFRRFGAGESGAHPAGRSLWQLADHDRLLVAWNATEEDPASVERRMLADFRTHYGKPPFANPRG